MKKSALALILIAFLSSIITFTTPFLLKNTRIGLEFRGGYEILYVAESTELGKPVEKAALLKTAEILGSRANTLGVSEPDVIVEGNNQICVKLAGVSSGEQVKVILNQPDTLPDHRKIFTNSRRNFRSRRLLQNLRSWVHCFGTHLFVYGNSI